LVIIWVTLVNTQTHPQTASDQLFYYLSSYLTVSDKLSINLIYKCSDGLVPVTTHLTYIIYGVDERGVCR